MLTNAYSCIKDGHLSMQANAQASVVGWLAEFY